MLVGELANSPQGLHSGRFDEENSNDHSVSAMNTTSPELVDQKSELLSETSNTMTLEQFTDIVLASEGMTLNNINNNTECTNGSSIGLGSAHGGATPTTNMTLNGGIEKVSITNNNFVHPKIKQTKMLVTCQRFGDLFLFGLIWQYFSNHHCLQI